VRTSFFVAPSILLAACTSQPPHAETAAPSAVPTAAATPTQVASAQSTPSAAPSTVATAPSPTASASAAPVADAPLPNVEVKFYGLHVGGGKNDKAEHAPIISSINAHTDDFKRCFAKVDDPKKGTFGVQLIIPGEGGKADVSHPKTTFKGDAFRDCMIDAYKGIDFEKPKGGVKTNATYSLIFTPEK
jgi:hypothetical protein